VRTTDATAATGGVDTIVSLGGVNVILGGVGGDLLDAPLGSNVVLGDNGEVNVGADIFTTEPGLGGDDVITGAADNVILGGFGADAIALGGGTNVVLGDNGIVRRAAGVVTQVATTDTTAAPGGDDQILSQAGLNVILGGVGADQIETAPGSTNVILGDDGEVNLNQPLANDVLTTEPALGGDDRILAGSTNVILGGAGSDTITLRGGTNTVLGDNGVVRRDGAHRVTRVETGDEDGATGAGDTITSLGGVNVILGGLGDDRIDAASGTNVVLGDNGAVDVDGDVVTTEPAIGGADVILGGADNVILGGAAGDQITLGGGTNTVLGDNGVVRRTAGVVTRVETGDVDGTTGGPDTITSLGGVNIVLGGAFADVLAAPAGTTIMLGDNGEVVVGGDVVTTEPAIGGADLITGGVGASILLGGALGDLITGGAGFDVVLGDSGIVRRAAGVVTRVESTDFALGGDDTIDGGGSDDVLLGGAGRDFLTAGAGDDVMVGDNGVVDLTVTPPLVTSAPPTVGGGDVLHGDDGDDTLYGGFGDDELYGELGSDTLFGEAGQDILLGDTGVVLATARLDANGSLHKDVRVTDLGIVTGRVDLDGLAWEDLDRDLATRLVGADLLLLAGAFDADGRHHILKDATGHWWDPWWFRWDTEILLITLVPHGNDTLLGGAGDDALYGGRGDDTLRGEAGRDFLEGDLGHDLLDGGDGDDQLVGDRATVLSPDGQVPNVVHALSLIDGPGSVADAAGVVLNTAGTTILPMVAVTPGHDVDPLPGLLATLTANALVPGANALARADGSRLVPFATLVPAVQGHLGLVAGNDTLLGGNGDDTLVGDDATVLVTALTLEHDLMARAIFLTADWVDLADDLGDLTAILHHAVADDPRFWNAWKTETVVDATLTIATDLLEGGAGNDLLVGDDHTVLAPSFTIPARNTDDFEFLVAGLQVVEHELEDAALELHAIRHHLRDEVVQQKVGWHWKTVLRHHVDRILVGNDRLVGGDGNDLLVGDQKFHMTPNVLVTPGGASVLPRHHWHDGRWWDDGWWDWRDHGDWDWDGGDDWDWHGGDWDDWDWDDDEWGDDDRDGDERGHDRRHHRWHHDYWSRHGWHHHHGAGDLLTVGEDALDGGAGHDLMFGDSQAVIAEHVARAAGVGHHHDDAVDDAEDALRELTELGHHHHHHGWWRHGDRDHDDHDDDDHHHGHDHFDEEDFQITSGNDVLLGGAGDDILLGQNGWDKLYGDEGEDYLVGGDDGDRLDGGAGRDTERRGRDTSSTLAGKIQIRLAATASHLRIYGASPALLSPSPWIASFELDLDDECHDEAFIIRPKARKKW
jgi:Ca2+-binding RTX toxin-like protein